MVAVDLDEQVFDHGPVGFTNPDVPWRELERTLSDRARRRSDVPLGANGGDSPAWSPQRPPYVPPPAGQIARRANVTPYAELHCHSAFSFLDGASQPEELAEEAARLGAHRDEPDLLDVGKKGDAEPAVAGYPLPVGGLQLRSWLHWVGA